MANVAFIGLGVMGFPMAGHLPGQGPRGDGLQPDRRQGRGSGASAIGGRRAATPREAAAGAEIVLHLRRQRRRPALGRLGDDGILAGLGAGAVLVDHTTASADVARELRAACRERAPASSMRRSRAGRPVPRTARSRSCAAARRTAFARARAGAWRPTARAVTLMGPAGAGPAHQDGQPDLHRRPRPGAGRGDQLRRSGRASTPTQVLATISKGAAQSWQMENRWQTMAAGQVRLRLRGRLDAQGPRRSASTRRGATAPPCRSPPWSTSSTA